MKLFTDLYLKLDRTTRITEKRQALEDYFRAAPALDAAWVVYLLSGRKIGRTVSTTLLRQWAAQETGYPPWLLDECHQTVGDLSETLSLLLPPGIQTADAPALHQIIERHIQPLAHLSRDAQQKLIRSTWAILSTDQRLVFHKLLGGNYRVGVSKQMLILALAQVAGAAPAVIAHRIAGNWKPDEKTMHQLLRGDADLQERALPYPFMLAHPLTAPLDSLGDIANWLVESKWDGIRAQIVRRAQTAIWSRGDELISGAFPELIQAGAALPPGTVLDGEIVAWDDQFDRPRPFVDLQTRLNRVNVELSFWPDVAIHFIAFDLLETNSQDLRAHSLADRRKLLQSVIESAGSHSIIRLSTSTSHDRWEQVQQSVAQARQFCVEGVMLKQLSSQYQAGRPTGLWWKLKVQPYTIDAVLIAAEPGRGRRAGLLTDYTFGLWHEGKLVPIAKAYSGLTDQEISRIDHFARRHTTARHGPIHSIQPLMVFELGFEAIQRSARHKSGLALRFPRMLRIRSDKKPQEADSLQTAVSLLQSTQGVR